MPQLIDRLQSVFAGTYTLERELGGGGMSRVFLAEETALSRQVVIKVLPPDMAAGVNKERFELETQLAASLQHPLIVPILTAGSAAPVEPDLLYYVMPFIDGLSLRDRMDREGELPVHEAVRIIRDVADALACAHEAGVVHRDIKPDNVMLSGKHAMVTDFGIAKAVSASQNDSQTGLTQMGTSLGTPMYMAPEQAAGDPNVDHRADIYALGCMAYEMLAGRLPFESDSVQALLAAHISQTPRPIAEHRPSIPAPLADAIMRCLAKKPADRWQSADQLSSVLDAVAGSSGVLTPASTQAINVDGFVRSQSPVRVVATFAGVGAVLVGVVYLLMIQLGLPDWTLQGTAMLTVGGVLAAGFSAWRGGAGWPVIRRVLVGGYGLFAAGTVTYTAMRMLGIGPVATLVAAGVLDDQGRLILAQFENATSDSTLSESVTELLRIDLAQSETVTLMEPMQIAQVLRRMQRDPNTLLTDDLAMEIAVREGVKAVLSGEIRSLAGDYIVSATLIATSTGETLAAARETASGGSLVGAVDRLSATLRERIGESLKTIRADAPLSEVTTVSTEALRLFVQAERANDRSEADQAIALLKQALDVDSSFAMAHRKLGIILRNQGQDPERAVAAFTRAYRLQDRLTDRERYLAEAAYYAYVTEDEAAAELAYTTLLDRYPTDPTALNNLAVNYRGRGRIAEAEELYRRSITNGGAPPVTFGNAVQTQYNLGMVDTAEVTLARFEEEYPGHPSLPNLHGALLSAQFRYAEADSVLAEWERRGSMAPVVALQIALSKGSFAAVRGELETAIDLFGEAYDIQERTGMTLIPQPRSVLDAIVTGFVNFYFLDDPETAVAEMDRALRQAGYDTLAVSQRDDLQVAGLYARSGRVDRARRMLATYERDQGLSGDEDDRTAGLWGAYGTLAIAEERFDDAVRLFAAAREESPDCDLCFRNELGEAYALAGQPDSAVAVLEEYLDARVLFRAQIDNFNLWSVLIQLGEAYEAVGRADDAVASYDRLLKTWERPDPKIQWIVDDLRGRIARLTGENRPTGS